MPSSRENSSDEELEFTPVPTRDAEKRRLREENEALRRQNADLMAHVQTLLKRIQEQEKIIRSNEEAAARRHAELLNQLQMMATKERETQAPRDHEMREEPAASTSAFINTPPATNPNKRPASPIEKDAKKQGVSASGKTDKPLPTIDNSSVSGQKKEKIPPVMMKRQERWGEISRALNTAKISFVKAKLTGGEIQIEPATAEDHRRLTRLLTEKKEEYYTYSLPDARHLRVVIRGLPTSIPVEDVKADLESKGFKVYEALRMTSRRTKQVMPLVLVKLPQGQDEVMKVNRCCSLVVKTEKQHEAARVAQCHRCQSFGHSQSNCKAEHRCVKCASNHKSVECPKPKEDPATCANCGGAHPASYRGCPKLPKRATRRPPVANAQRSPPKKTTPPAPKVTPGRSFAEAAKGKSKPITTNKTSSLHREEPFSAAHLTAALAQMQQMCSAMSAFFAKMPASFSS